MSNYSSDMECYDVHSKTRRKARKQHLCDACGFTIRPGHYYMRIYTVFEGTSDTIVRCGRCEAMHVHLVQKGNEPEEYWSKMYPQERLDCGIAYERHWGTQPPLEIAALAFLSEDEAGDILAP